MIVRDSNIPVYKNSRGFLERRAREDALTVMKWFAAIAIISAIGLILSLAMHHGDMTSISGVLFGFSAFIAFGLRFDINLHYLPQGNGSHCRKVYNAFKETLFPFSDSLAPFFGRMTCCSPIPRAASSEVLAVLFNVGMLESKPCSEMNLRELVAYVNDLKQAFDFCDGQRGSLQLLKGKLRSANERLTFLMREAENVPCDLSLVDKEHFYCALLEAGISRKLALSIYQWMEGEDVVVCWTPLLHAKVILCYYQCISSHLFHTYVSAQDRESDKANIAQLLLLGADPNARNEKGKTALMVTDDPAIAELLVRAGGHR